MALNDNEPCPGYLRVTLYDRYGQLAYLCVGRTTNLTLARLRRRAEQENGTIEVKNIPAPTPKGTDRQRIETYY